MIKVMNQGAPRVKKVKQQALTREFELLAMKDKETVVDFAAKLSRIVNQIRELGKELKEEVVVVNLLRSLPMMFNHIVP